MQKCLHVSQMGWKGGFKNEPVCAGVYLSACLEHGESQKKSKE